MWLYLLALLVLIFLYRWYRHSLTLENLSDEYVLITGCDSGFGNQLAKSLDKRGMRVLATCLTEQGAENLKKETSSRLQTVILDIANSKSVQFAAKWVSDVLGGKGLWGLVNNAGTGMPGAPNEWLSRDDFAKVLNVNLLGPIDVTLRLLPLIRKSKGRIVNVSSIVGRVTICGGGYCISKFGVEAFSDSLRRELKPFGVQVSIIEPGYFKTGLNNMKSMKDTLRAIWKNVHPEIHDSYGEKYFQDSLNFYTLYVMWLPLLVLVGLILLYRWHRQSQILENLSDKYVFITGCDTGFGNLLVKQLDKRGMKVLAGCLTETGAENLKKETSSRVQTIILDVTDSQGVRSAVDWIEQHVKGEGLWGLVNNAGITIPTAPNGWLSKDDFVKVLSVNLLGMIDVTLNLLPLIMRARGRIINVSSVMGRLAFVGGGYSISRFGVEAFSDSMRRELRPFGISVSVIEPSSYKTPATDVETTLESLYSLWSQAPKWAQESYGQQYFEVYCRFIQYKLSRCNPHITQVTNCMEHALTAVYPWTRYSAGWITKLFYLPVSYLPTFMSDYLLAHPLSKPPYSLPSNNRK
ncbi:retinol dehydrogenase 7-like isoform X1 [Rhinoderma darwinii]|uniref:retinol dehydrogenase 7-like isoform X1 n=1 Tax=Rhinoderma darwinii TaxID=43563 RepID=UPI003F6818B7